MSKFLIHVGYPKSGSCYLGEWFHQHPSFIFEDFKLAGFKSTSDLCDFAVSNNDQVKYFVIRDMLFTCPLINKRKGVNDIDEYQEKVCTTLNNLFPNSKILIVTRGFESATISRYFQYVKEGGILSLSSFIENNINSRWFIYNYSYLISIYRKYFGDENVIVLPYELLKDSREEFLKYIETKLGIPSLNKEIGTINESLPKNIIYTQLKLNIAISNFSKLTGKPGSFLLKLYLKELKSKNTASKNRFILTNLLSFFHNNKKDVTNIPFEIIPKELLLKFEKFAFILKEYPIYQKYYNDYFLLH